MSSILEALRELEGNRPPPAHPVAAPAEQPTPANRATETLGIVAIGLLVGALAVGLVIWISGILNASVESDPAPAPPPEQTLTAPSPTAPGWLDRTDPPRALVDARAPGASGRPAPRMLARRSETDAPASTGHVEVTSIDYSPQSGRRSVSLRLDGGDVVTLHESESAHGVEVQLIQPDGVYVRRGGEVLMLAPGR